MKLNANCAWKIWLRHNINKISCVEINITFEMILRKIINRVNFWSCFSMNINKHNGKKKLSINKAGNKTITKKWRRWKCKSWKFFVNRFWRQMRVKVHLLSTNAIRIDPFKIIIHVRATQCGARINYHAVGSRIVSRSSSCLWLLQCGNSIMHRAINLFVCLLPFFQRGVWNYIRIFIRAIWWLLLMLSMLLMVIHTVHIMGHWWKTGSHRFWI